MAITYLSIGSNSGNRIDFLRKCINSIALKIGIIDTKSKIYESESWGYESSNFLNMVVKVETTLLPLEVLQAIHKIETELGRIKVAGKYTDRTIDIDILFYDKMIFKNETLTVPHPHLQNRLFVLVPFLDVDPEFKHPVLNKTIKQLFLECSDSGWIKIYNEFKE